MVNNVVKLSILLKTFPKVLRLSCFDFRKTSGQLRVQNGGVRAARIIRRSQDEP